MGSAAHKIIPEDEEILLDDGRWPCLIVRPPYRVSDEQMEDFLERYRMLEQERGERYALVLDLRRTSKLTPDQRKMLTDRMEDEDEDPSKVLCQGTAMIFESRILRGILSMIFWVKRPPYPTKVFTEPEEAIAWANELLASRGPAPARQPPAATGGAFFVQCDAHISFEKARAIMDRVESLGLQGQLERETTAERTVYVPRLGPFATRNEALDAIDRLDEEQISARLLTRD